MTTIFLEGVLVAVFSTSVDVGAGHSLQQRDHAGFKSPIYVLASSAASLRHGTRIGPIFFDAFLHERQDADFTICIQL